MKSTTSFAVLSGRLYLLLTGIKHSVSGVPSKYRTILPRFAAGMFDSFILAPPLIILALYALYATETSSKTLWICCAALIPAVYYIYFLGRYGATPGMRLLACRVVSTEGEKLVSFGRAALWLSPELVLSIFAIRQGLWGTHSSDDILRIVGWGWLLSTYAWIGLNQKRRALHDLLAGCVFVNTEAEVSRSAHPTYQIRHPNSALPTPINRFGAGAINIILFTLIRVELISITEKHYPYAASVNLASWLLIGFVLLFWIGCSIARSSPGAFLAQLQVVKHDGSPISLKTSLMRNLLYLLMGLLYVAPWGDGDLMFAAGVVRTLFLFGGVGLLLISGYTLMENRTTLIDRWLGISVIAPIRRK